MQNNSYSSTMLNNNETKELLDKMKMEQNQTLPALNIKKSLFETSSKSQASLISTDIKVNMKYVSLKTALDSLEPIHEFNEKTKDDKFKNEDLFKKNKYKDRILETDPNNLEDKSLDEIIL